uniref:non-specific serine/threonine protein kinase n=2 Tax=Haptolina ericina TaxID=156174 RepID=A0A7S3B5K1_9EUKA|mmetsp:Transcript_51743/g.116179  ORF Transcript_51743/g.116179 Transcript_51743/m.116179 type:complete len:632 (+) Transcript_51743:93-1988(+)|eukprot:CAMPEP_0181194062 /NCGR_PEP_ID=MMETSP1096-20121128/14141_1 /TAXON_ID=156174 ORGANISM="Chrysochromulina ericina, Strain CCMP281" /NCGR_SAMPLE_ID=MMETSP1096 /ASSEMBLY_ACC=CAM_ASM_000453 /LENGTH=631 /DNA_ID=CAMNT_0023283549 /DNA_START=93 /DNA_END=1988 /DNA_ORIENTATION=-
MQSADAANASTSGVAEAENPETLLTPDGQFRIDASEMGLLGSGAHGVVRIAQNVDTLDYVAVKIMPTSVIRTAIKEVLALTRLNHSYIVQLLSVQVDTRMEKVYVLMELCQGGELFDRIAECGGLDEGEAKRYFAQILSVLRHCHENKVYHRDLKPENILLDAEDNAKVADFGLAAVYRHVSDDATFLRHTKVGSVMYAAPEVLTSTAGIGYDAACADMWSLGIILFSMLSGTLPFQCAAASRCKRYAAVLRQGIQVMCPEHLSPSVTSLLGRMLDPDPKRRFTPAEALQCEWLQGALPPQLGELQGSRPRVPIMRSWTVTMAVPQRKRGLPAPSTEGEGDVLSPSPSVGGGSASSADSASNAEGKRRRCSEAVGSTSVGEVGASSAAGSSAAGGSAIGCGTAGCGTAASSSARGQMLPPAPVAIAASAGRSAGCGAVATSAAGGRAPSGCVACASSSQSRASSAGGSSSSSSSASSATGDVAAARADVQAGCASCVAQQAPPPAMSADFSGAARPAASSSGGSCIQGLPLRGVLSEFVSECGWGPLPQGTEQLLRDILQTLRSMGLQYTLQEQHSVEGSTDLQPESWLTPALAGQLDVPSSGGTQMQRITLKIHFSTLGIQSTGHGASSS